MNGYGRGGVPPSADGIPVALFRGALLLAVCLIGYLAFTPVVHSGAVQVWDKLNHAAAFYVLALLLDFSQPRMRFGAAKGLALLAYGVTIEAVQYFLPYREASVGDLLADAIGVFAYLCSIPLLARIPLLSRRWRGR